MASSGNFCTLNPLAQLGSSTDASTRAGSMSNGNLKYVNLTGNTAVGTFGVTSGKWYYEVYVSSFNSDNGMAIGWANDLFNLDAELGYNSPSSPSGGQAFGLYSQNQKLIYGPGDGSSTYNKSYGSGTPTDGDIIRIWLDADNGRFWAGLNGTIWGSGDPSAGTNWGFGTGGSPHNVAISSRTLYPAIGNWSAADGTVIFNFGQDSTFQGAVSAGGNADGNGFGDFKYDPDGFLALCSANVPISSDIDPAGDDGETENPTKQFNVLTYTGNANTNAITGLGFKPDLIWAKMFSSSQNNQLYDSSRMNTRGTPTPFGLRSDTTDAEFDDQSTGNNNPIIASFDTDGFTLGTSGSGPNDNARTYVAWCWKANGGTTASNSNGSITSTVQANTKAGFSIATYTSPNSSSNKTVGHGLSGVDFVITKNRDATFNWYCFHSDSSGKTYRLNSGTEHSYSNWSMGATTWGSENGYTHDGTSKFVAYAWQNVAGMQHFGSYIGNGNADGPFVYTGFRPRLIFTLLTNSSSGWRVRDTARDTVNPSDSILWWNLNYQEYSQSGYNFDILSNGFKLRNTGSDFNSDGSKYLFGAWGDVPFKYNNTF